MTEWHEFDYNHKRKTAPPKKLWDELVWVLGTMPGGDPDVDLAVYNGRYWVLWTGTDDISVDFWAPLVRPTEPYPEAPESHWED